MTDKPKDPTFRGGRDVSHEPPRPLPPKRKPRARKQSPTNQEPEAATPTQ